MGRDVAIDASDIPAYANGHRTDHDGNLRNSSDPDASWETYGKGAVALSSRIGLASLFCCPKGAAVS